MPKPENGLMWRKIVGSTVSGTVLMEMTTEYLARLQRIEPLVLIETGNDPADSLGQRVIDWCWQKDMSFRKFAARANVSPSTISRVTANKAVTHANFERIRKALER